MFVVIAKQKIQSEKIQLFKDSVAVMAPKTRMYPGCVSYELLQSKYDESVFIFHELWDNEADFEAHFEADFTKKFEDVLQDISDGPVEPYICEIVV